MTNAEAGDVLQALIGAFIDERGADFATIANLWHWLAGADALKTASFCLKHAIPDFKGRTPTYECIGQVMADDGVPELHVTYVRLGTVRYRRPRADGQTIMGSCTTGSRNERGEEEWLPIYYDAERATLVSDIFRVPGPKNQQVPAALPNKVQHWTRGTCLSGLLPYKRAIGNTMSHEVLREMRDGSLLVRYTKYGLHAYKRCPYGGIGYEQIKPPGGETAALPLFYSERQDEKAIASPHYPDQLVPNKVTEWLLARKCLVQLMNVTRDTTDEPHVEYLEESGTTIKWRHPEDGLWTASRLLVTGGVIIVAGKDEQCLGEVMYHEGTCKAANGTELPGRVAKWIKKRPPCEEDEALYIEATIRRKTATLATHLYAPSQSGTWFANTAAESDPGRVEAATKHSFANRMLLAEAMLAPTAKGRSMTTDCQRLAVVGEMVPTQLVTRILLANAPQCATRTLTAADSPHGRRAFVVAPQATLDKDAPCRYNWPGGDEAGLAGDETRQQVAHRVPVRNSADLERRRLACCNHLAYAKSAVRLGLHENMLQLSPKLARAVRAFVRAVNKADAAWDRKRSNPWPALLRQGAPRALGDIFLACIGAMIMDCAQTTGGCPYLEAEKVILQHILDCDSMELPSQPALYLQSRPLVSTKDLVDAVDADEHGTMDSERVLEPYIRCHEAGSKEPKPTEAYAPADKVQTRMGGALVLRDVNFIEVGGHVVHATSPRSALCKGLVIHSAKDDELSTNDGETSSGVTTDHDEPLPGERAQQAVYCLDCELWLNGPVQFLDHRVGKKHKKRVKSMASSRKKGKKEPNVGKANQTAESQTTNSPQQHAACSAEGTETMNSAGSYAGPAWAEQLLATTMAYNWDMYGLAGYSHFGSMVYQDDDWAGGYAASTQYLWCGPDGAQGVAYGDEAFTYQ